MQIAQRSEDVTVPKELAHLHVLIVAGSSVFLVRSDVHLGTRADWNVFIARSVACPDFRPFLIHPKLVSISVQARSNGGASREAYCV